MAVPIPIRSTRRTTGRVHAAFVYRVDQQLRPACNSGRYAYDWTHAPGEAITCRHCLRLVVAEDARS